MRLSEIARGVFQKQLGSIQLHLDGCIVGEDPIHLHDLRVANRRTRAALIEFKKLFPADVLEQYQEDFRWIHQITGPVRDLDVTLSHYPTFKREIPKSWRRRLKPLRKLLEEKRKIAQQELAEILGSEKVGRILDSWQSLLEEGVIRTDGVGAEQAREYGCKRIIKRYRKNQIEGGKLTKSTPAEEFHKYRISVKKLRYLMEFYRPVMDQEDFGKLRGGLKSVQDTFGAFQDTDVQVEKLKALADELYQEGASVEAMLAIGLLLGVLEGKQKKSKKRCLRQTRWLISEGTARNFQSCFMYPVD